MKNAFTKILTLFSVILLASGSFSSCSINGSESNDNKDAISLTALNFESKPATLKFYFMGDEAKDTRLVLDEIEKNVANTLNIKLDFKWIPNREYVDKIISLLAAGDSIDGFYVNSGFESFVKALIGRGYSPDELFADITELFPNNAPMLYTNFGDEIKQASYNGKLVMIPHNLSGSTRMCAVVRQDLMERYHVPEIKTYDEYEVYLKAVKENEKSVTPAINIYGINGEAFGYAYLNYEIYYKWDDPNITLIPWERTPEYVKAIEMLKRWNDKGYLYVGSENYDTLLSSGNVSAFIAPWDEAYQWAQTLGKNQKMKIYPLNMNQTASKTPVTSAAMVFSKKSGNIERAVRFIEWIESSQENYDTMIYGIKEKHYALNNNRISFPAGEAVFYSWSGSDAFFNINYIREAAFTDYNYRDLYGTMVETNAKFPPATGFYPDESRVEEFINNRRSFGTMEQAVIDGKITIDEFVDTQKDQGIDELLAELQRQLNNWRAEAGN